MEIELSKLKENPYQPRIEIKKDEIIELANSIKEKGLLQPIVVKREDEEYIIIAGHRRVEAHKLLGEEKIKARVIEANDENMASLSLIENLQRKDLDIIETAIALKHYKESFNKKLEEIGQEIGKSKGYISQILNILNLPEEILQDIKENKSTKDITALSWINSYAKKIGVSVLTDSENSLYNDDSEEIKKGKNEIIEIYKGFLANGREWLKREIEKRLKPINKKTELKAEFGKRKTKLEINVPLTPKIEEKIKKMIEELTEELKIDDVKIKDNKYLKKEKKEKKESIEEMFEIKFEI